MKNNIYDLVNEVKIDLNEYDKENFTDIEKRKIKNNLKKSMQRNSTSTIYKKYGVAASIVLLMAILFTTNLGNNVWSFANTIAYDIANCLGIEKNLDEYKTVVNQSISKNGITIQLNEVILDNDQIVVSTTSTSNEKLGEGCITFTRDVYINGKNQTSGVSGGQKKIDEYTAQSIMFYKLENNLSGDLNIKLVFSNPLINEKTISGDWTFEFKANGDELKLDTKEILLNYTFTLENGEKITLEKYTSNNLGQKIYFSTGSKGATYDMILKGHDDLKNEIGFCLSSIHGCNGIFKLTTIDGNLDENAKKLSLTPYAVKFPEKSGKLSNDFKKTGEEFTIDLLE